jgi:predicted NACHT family NTPase
VQWLREVVTKINSEARGGVDIRDFLSRVELLLSVVNRLVHTTTFGREVFKLKREKHYENRFAISAHEVFDTGMNVAVYGEAGAGKSTTLHIYVKRRSARARPSDKEALVFLPINRVMSAKSANGFSEERDLGRLEFVRALLKCTLIYVGSEPSDRSVEEFLAWIKTRSRITFIVDGLDEAITNNSWLLRAINGIPTAFSNSQVIISSRDCISEINDIDFLGITLLPFTEPQLKRFIEGWSPKTGRDLWTSIKDSDSRERA